MLKVSDFFCVKVLLVLYSVFDIVCAQEIDCYGPGSIAGAVIGTLLATIILLALSYFVHKHFWKPRREKHLVLETDPEHGDKYAFDNPCFKDAGSGGLTPIGKALDKSGTRLIDSGKKWSQWSPLGALVSTKNEKRRTLDDSHIEGDEVKVVSLRSHDFTGLGFNICGNMKDGIYIKDVLHRGPASESGKLNPGDRINSVRISFEHMVYEDALTILSYASPYEVQIEAKGNIKGHHGLPGSGGAHFQSGQPKHPLYRSSSTSDIVKIEKSARQRLFVPNENLDTSSANTTLEKSRKSPKSDINSLTKPERTKKSQAPIKNLSPEQLKSQLEHSLSQKIAHGNDYHTTDHKITIDSKTDLEKQTSEADNKNRFQKFGIRVLPPEIKQENAQPARSPKTAELSQNDNNINLERHNEQDNLIAEGIDEVDKKLMNGNIDNAPLIKKREKIKNGDTVKNTVTTKEKDENFERQNSLNSSGIKRDKAGIPQEIPDHMLQAAVAARRNRKSSEIVEKPAVEDDNELVKTPKKTKGKAPAPPPAEKLSDSKSKLNFSDNLDEISTIEEKESKIAKPAEEATDNSESDKIKDSLEKPVDETKEYCSDSDMETDNQSSVNTIELNSSDITIHHSEENAEVKNRKTVSTGDLSKIQKDKKSNTGTLERAQSLDITDSGIPTLTKKRKATKDVLESKLSSDESLYDSKSLKNKEPRLSLALDGLDTFQRNRLKKSSEWGNLEDVIMNLDKMENDDSKPPTDSEEKIDFIETITSPKFDFGLKDTKFGDTITNLNDIQITLVDDDDIIDLEKDQEAEDKIKNILWPNSNIVIQENVVQTVKPQIVDKKEKTIEKTNDINDVKVHNILWPVSDHSNEQQIVQDNLSDATKHSISTQNSESLPISNQNDSETTTLKHHSKTEIIDENKSIEKPVTPQKPVFSLKAQFQENLNSKLNETSPNIPQSKTTTQITGSSYSVKPQPEQTIYHPGKSSQNFIFAEKYASNNDSDNYVISSKLYDTNISDDIKVSRHSLGSLERPKSDVLKNVNKLKMKNLISSDLGGVSNVPVTENSEKINENGYQNEKSIDLGMNYDMSTASELYTTAIDASIEDNSKSEPEFNKKIDSIVVSPEIKNITITETITDIKYTDSPSSLTIDTSSDGPDSIKSNTLTFVTEIQVTTPTNGNQIDNKNNISEIEITTDNKTPKTEESLKTLPEMKFTTSSYESPKTPEKKISHIELLRSNFEKSPPKTKSNEVSPSKSRIPVFKSPDRKETKLNESDSNDEREIVEIMSSAVHSTPVTTNINKFSSLNKTNNASRNVTVTSIRTSSKIPSGQHSTNIYSHKPPVPARPNDHSADSHESRTVSANGNTETFKQWVFNPNESAITNIVVNNNKDTHK